MNTHALKFVQRFRSPIVEGARMLGAEAELDCQPHTAPLPNSMLLILSGPGTVGASPNSSLTSPHLGLTKQSLMTGCYQPQPDIEVCELSLCSGSDPVLCDSLPFSALVTCYAEVNGRDQLEANLLFCRESMLLRVALRLPAVHR